MVHIIFQEESPKRITNQMSENHTISEEQLKMIDIKIPESPLPERDCLVEFCEKHSLQLAIITKNFDSDNKREGFYAVIHQKNKDDFIFKSNLFESQENAIASLYNALLKSLRALSVSQVKDQLL